MIELHFHWAWILLIAVILIGVVFAYPFITEDNDRYGCSAALGCTVILVAVMLALILGGIFIW